MKNIKHILLSTGVAAGLLAGNTAVGADDPPAKQPSPADPKSAAQPPPDAPAPAPAPSDTPAADEQTVPQPAAQPTTPAATNTPAATTPAAGPPTAPATGNNAPSSVDESGNIRFNFHNTRLDQILEFMSKAAGYIVLDTPRSVDLSTKVTVYSDQPVTREEALVLLKQVLAQNGYQVIVGEPNDRGLRIITRLEATRSDVPVVLFKGSPSDVPKTPDVFTYIIPVRSLNAVALIRDLQQLLPSDTTITANESGNSLVMTSSQINVRRVVEIVKALDSVSSSSSTITVFPLKFADAKTIASLIKDLFPAADSSRSGGGGMNPFAQMRGMFGGGGRGGGGGDASDTGNGHTPTTRITAVFDDRSNSVAVSSPDEMVPTITELINQLDTNVQDLTEMRAFKLKNADPSEMADELTKLFPDPSKTDDTTGFGGRRIQAFGFPGMGGQNNSASTSSDRTKKVNQVTAVADPRTSSVIITAGKDVMPSIASLIETLDVDPSGKKRVLVFDLKSADPTSVLQVLQDAFPSNTKTSSSASTSSSTLATRAQTLQQQQNSSTSATSTSFGSTPGGR